MYTCNCITFVSSKILEQQYLAHVLHIFSMIVLFSNLNVVKTVMRWYSRIGEQMGVLF